MRHALLLFLVVPVAFAQEPFTAAERARLREAFHRVLFAGQDTSAEARGSIVELAGEERVLAALDVLRAGPRHPDDAARPREPERWRVHGAVTTGYVLEHEGERFGYAVSVPEGYDPERPSALLLDPGHGSGADDDPAGKAGFLEFYRARADAAGCDDWLLVRSEIVEQVGPGGLRGERPEAEVVPLFLALLRDVSSRYAVDPDRVFVAGLSQTAFWAWVLGAARADRFAGLVPMASVTWQLDPVVENVRNLSIYALHGSEDDVCPVGPTRRTYRRVAAVTPGFRYVEVEGAGHGGPVFARVTDGLAWLRERRRDPVPRSVSKSLATLHDPWAYWLRVDELDRVGSPEAGAEPTGGVDAEVEGQTVRVYSEGVGRLTVLLAPRLVDLERPVTVEWNGRRAHRGRVEPDLDTALVLARARGDWGALFPAVVRLD